MPHDQKEAIREDVVAAQRELTQVLDRVGPDDWSRIGPNEGWTVRDLLTHLVTSETGVCLRDSPNVCRRWRPRRFRSQQGQRHLVDASESLSGRSALTSWLLPLRAGTSLLAPFSPGWLGDADVRPGLVGTAQRRWGRPAG